MFCTKYKNRIKELESYEKVYDDRIKHQSEIIDSINTRYKGLQAWTHTLESDRLIDIKVLAALKKECLEKGEQINKLQELVNNRKDDGVDNVDELKRTIEKQAVQIGRMEAFKKRIQQKKKIATNKKAKNKKK